MKNAFSKKQWLSLVAALFGVIFLTVLILRLFHKNRLFENTTAINFDETAWHYDSEHKIYYQLGVKYAANAAEVLNLYVPAEFLKCDPAADDAYACELNNLGTRSNYTAASAPVVLPVEDAALAAEYDYGHLFRYLERGVVYLEVGCPHAPAAKESAPAVANTTATDSENTENTESTTAEPALTAADLFDDVASLKAAVRFLRYNSAKIPGDKDAIFASGFEDAALEVAVLGASGDSPLYSAALENLGAVRFYDDGAPVSDVVAGVNLWSPTPELSTADAAYAWSLGQFADEKTDKTITAAESYANYINNTAKFPASADARKDAAADALTLEKSAEGVFLKGNYYDFLISALEQSLETYLATYFADDADARDAYLSDLGDWVTYEDGKAEISNLAGFVASQKPFLTAEPEKTAENTENSEATKTALDATAAAVTPSFFLLSGAGFDGSLDSSATPAKYWRLRAGLSAPAAPLTTELSLALALETAKSSAEASAEEPEKTAESDKAAQTVENVDFQLIWAAGATRAELTDSPDLNFLLWLENFTKGW